MNVLGIIQKAHSNSPQLQCSPEDDVSHPSRFHFADMFSEHDAAKSTRRMSRIYYKQRHNFELHSTKNGSIIEQQQFRNRHAVVIYMYF